MAKTLTKEEKEDFHKRLAEIKKVFDEKKREVMATMAYVPTPTHRAGANRGFELFNGWVTVRFEPDYAKGFDAYRAHIVVYLDDKKETAFVWQDNVSIRDTRMDKYEQSMLVFKLVRDHVSPDHLATAMHHSEHYDQMKFLTDRAEHEKIETWSSAMSAVFGDGHTTTTTPAGFKKASATALASSTLHVTTPTVSQDGTVKTPPE